MSREIWLKKLLWHKALSNVSLNDVYAEKNEVILQKRKEKKRFSTKCRG
jgi:hypothetical protein